MGKNQRKYSTEFKKRVIMDMLENHLACRETVRKYWGTKNKAEEDLYRSTVKRWKHIYLEERADGLMKSRQGKMMGKPPKTDKKVEEDLIAENQRLRILLKYSKHTKEDTAIAEFWKLCVARGSSSTTKLF